jgi:hypothetical protein
MPIVSIILRSIDANKLEELTNNINVNNKVNATGVKERDFPGIGQSGLAVTFNFLSSYTDGEKTIGEIKMTGEVWVMGPECKEIMKMWKKEKKIPEDSHIEIINTIFRKCVSKAVVLAEDVQLPPPIGLPFAQKEKKE